MLLGGAGIDILNGGDNDDVLVGGSGDDTLDGGNGNDLLRGGSGINTLTGGIGNDSFFFENTNGVSRFDTVTDFNLTNDVIDLSDILDASFTLGTQADFIELRELGGSGVALVRIDIDGTANGVNFVDIADLNGISLGNNVNFLFNNSTSAGSVTVTAFNEIPGTAGTDILPGTAGDDLISGLAGIDILTGLGGNDILDGGDGNDTLDGGTGNDSLEGGLGTNTLTGGAGSDKFVSTDVLGFDTITDFGLVDDLLDVSALLDDNFNVANQATYIQAVETSGNTNINIDPDGVGVDFNFVNVALLTGVGAGSTINFILDDVGSQSSVVSA